MSFVSWILWGFVATVILTAIMAGSQGLGLTRMNIPYLLGTMITPNRDRAQLYGVLLHFLNGWIFSFLYVAAFELLGLSTWWAGAVMGLVHSAFVLGVGLPLMPCFHHRMASEHHGPDAPRPLEPPGWFGLHYGVRTPVSIVIAHLVYGSVLGAFYAHGGAAGIS